MAGVTGRFFPTHGHHLGQGGTFASFNEATLNNGGAGPFLGHLGQVVEDNGAVYRLVQHDKGTGSVATAAGGAAVWKTRASYLVSMDGTDSQAPLNGCAGAYLRIVTDQYYCYVQLGGVQAVTTDTTCAAGKALILPATTTDGTLVATTTNTHGDQLIYAVSYGTNSTTSCNAYWVLGALL